METLSIVISAYNEENSIKNVLKSVSWADEIVVIDNESTDKTAVVAKDMGALVFTRPNDLMLNKNKNFGFEKATKDWILNLDADEVVPNSLEKEIKSLLHKETSTNGYWIPRKNIIFGKWIQHGVWWPDKQLRLFRRNLGKFPCIHVHEYISVQGETKELQEAFVHYNYTSVSQYITKLNSIYTENEAFNLKKKGYVVIWFDAIRMPVGDFVKVYFAQEGYKDGLHGLILALLQAFYALVVFAKVWETEKFKEEEIPFGEIKKEITHSKNEIQYWEKTVEMREEKRLLPKFLLKLKRKYVKNR